MNKSYISDKQFYIIYLHLYQKLSTIFPLIPLATRKEDLLHIYTDI